MPDPAIVDAFAQQLHGQLLHPHDPGYESARQV